MLFLDCHAQISNGASVGIIKVLNWDITPIIEPVGLKPSMNTGPSPIIRFFKHILIMPMTISIYSVNKPLKSPMG